MAIKSRFLRIAALSICILMLLAPTIFAGSQPEQPVEQPYQEDEEIPFFEAFMLETMGSSGEEPFGILFDVPAEVPRTMFQLNEVTLELTGGSLFLWRGEVFADIEQLEQQMQNQTVDLTSRRRPENWTISVVRGVVKAELADPELAAQDRNAQRPAFSRPGSTRSTAAQPGQAPTLILVAGTALTFDREAAENGENPFTVAPISVDDAQNIFAAVGATSEAPLPCLLNAAQVARMFQSQSLLLLIEDLSDIEMAAALIIGEAEITGVDAAAADTTSIDMHLIEFLIAEAEVSPDQLGDLASTDPEAAGILMDSITFSNDGVEVLGELSATTDGMIDLFTGLMETDDRAVDVLIAVAATDEGLAEDFADAAAENPELADIMIDRISESRGSQLMVVDLGEEEPLVSELLLEVVALDPEAGVPMLTTLLEESDAFTEQMVTLITTDPDARVRFEAIVAAVDDPALLDELAAIDPALAEVVETVAEPTPTSSSSGSGSARPTSTPTATPTETAIPPTSIPPTSVPPTAVPPTATNTPIPPPPCPYSSVDAATVTFNNYTGGTVDIYEINQSCVQVYVTSISAGTSGTVNTFATHTLRVRDQATSAFIMDYVVPGAGGYSVNIGTPPPPPPPCPYSSVDAATVTFNNYTGGTVDLYWIDGNCAEVFYASIANGGSVVQSTYATHAWRGRDQATSAVVMDYVVPSGGSHTVNIGTPPPPPPPPCPIDYSQTGTVDVINNSASAVDVYLVDENCTEVYQITAGPGTTVSGSVYLQQRLVVRDQATSAFLTDYVVTTTGTHTVTIN